MLYRKLFAALAIAGALTVPATSFASTQAASLAAMGNQSNAAPCILHEYRVASVAPYRHERVVGQAQTVSELIGASVFVPAQPGLTAEWLRASLENHIAEMRGTPMQDCPFNLQGVSVTVDSAGPGFSVKITADDSKKAEEVLRRARLLVG